MTGGGGHSESMDPLRAVPPRSSQPPPVVDTYSTSEAARLLGNRDPSQIRQWVKAGRLHAVTENPYRIARESVHRLRDEFKTSGGGAGRHAGQAVSSTGHPVDVERLVASIVQQVMPRALEAQAAASDKVETILRAQLDVERDRALRAERTATETLAELDRVRAAQAATPRRRSRLWGPSH